MIVRLAVAAVALGALSASAAPDAIQACVKASETGQQEQKQGNLFAARRAFEQCGDESCPAVVRGECTRWLEQVLEAMPSLIVVVRVDGVDQPPSRVLLDGEPWLAQVSGKPWELDPGEHRISVEVGALTQEQRLVVNVGEKNRRVVFQLVSPVVAPVVGPRPAPVLPVIATGVTALGVSLFTGLGLSGRARLERLLSNECAATKTCNPAAVADVQRHFIAADISLAVSAASAIAATWLWLRWFATEPAVTPAVSTLQDGLRISLSGSF